MENNGAKDGVHKLLSFATLLKVSILIAGIIVAMNLAPLSRELDKACIRIERLEESQTKFRVEMMEFRIKQQAQTETLQKISNDVEYLRRREERRP